MKGYKKTLVIEGNLVWAMRDLNSRLPPCKTDAEYLFSYLTKSTVL